MNRRQRRAQKKKRKLIQEGEYPPADWVVGPYKAPEPEPREPDIPGVTVRPEFPEFTNKVNSNVWHDIPELTEWIETIKKLSNEEDENNEWSWARNWSCKYIQIRFDMRDGGFIVTDDDGRRINLDQLRWQYRSANVQV